MNRRLIVLESTLAERMGALETSVNHLVFLVERIAQAQGLER
jgi:hypothetical protein